MKRNLLWLALIVSIGVQVFGSALWMGRLQRDVGRLTSEVESLRRANLLLAERIDELQTDIAGEPVAMVAR